MCFVSQTFFSKNNELRMTKFFYAMAAEQKAAVDSSKVHKDSQRGREGDREWEWERGGLPSRDSLKGFISYLLERFEAGFELASAGGHFGPP